jgi:signal transduction histidine kinase
MPKEVLNKLFQPHFTTKKSGHGFGLVTCEKIIKNHSGSITVESQPQKGSTFIISLPTKENLSHLPA